VHCADHHHAKGWVEWLVKYLWTGIRLSRDAAIDPQSTFDMGALWLGVTVTSMEQLLLARVEVGCKDDGALAFDVGEDGL
jgi:hypothetical protein